MVTDARLIQMSLAGDAKAFGGIVERYKQLACALAYSATGSAAVSEDIAQEAFVVAWQNLARLESPDKLRPWLAGIIRNVAGDWFRRRSRDSRRIEALQHHPQSPPETPREAAIARERQEIVWKAIEQIPEPYRVALVLYYREQMSVQCVADALQLTPDAAKQRLARGRAMVREQLASLVEDTLRRTGPSSRFTAGVLAVLVPPVSAPAAKAVAKPYQAAFTSLVPATLTPVRLAGLGVVLFLVGLAMVQLHQEPVVHAFNQFPAAELRSNKPDTIAAPAEPHPGLMESKNELPSIPAESDAMKTPETAVSQLPSVYLLPPGYPGTDPAQAPSDVVFGTVYDNGGSTASHATVWASRFGSGMRDTHETTTDDAGKFELAIPPGVWRLRARCEQESAVAPIEPRGLFTTEGRGVRLNVDIRMQQQGRVRGQITEAETGRPIPYAKLWTDDEYVVTADEDGCYVLEGVSPGPHCLFAITPGRVRRYLQFCTAFQPNCDLNFNLKEAASIHGRVVTEDGRPVAFAWLELPGSLWGAGNGLFEMCDEQGRFEYEGLPINAGVALHARIPAYNAICGDAYPRWKKEGVCQSIDCRTGKGAVLPELTFVLRAVPLEETAPIRDWPEQFPSGVVCGYVVDQAGQPITDFRVMLQSSRSEGVAQDQRTSLEVNSWGEGFSFTSDDGSFALTTYELEPGKYVRVVATAEGYGEAAHDVVLVQPIERYSRTVPLVFQLPAPSPLAVRVVDTSGKPVAQADVFVREPMRFEQHRQWLNDDLEGMRGKTCNTDEDGWVRFDDAGMASGDVAARKAGLAVARVFWNGEPEIQLVLQAECAIEGDLFDPWQRPLWEGYLTLKHITGAAWDYFSPDNESFTRTITQEDGGHVRIESLPPGSYVISIDNIPELLQVGVDSSGKPVTSYSSQSHIFYQEFTLAPGETYQFTCPDDSAHNYPEAWLSVGVSADDLGLQSELVGNWVSATQVPDGKLVYDILNFSPDGRYERHCFATNSMAYHEEGHFKVTNGLLWQLPNRADTLARDSEWTGSSRGDLLTLTPTGTALHQEFQRVPNLEAAITDALSVVGPPVSLPYTPIDPIPLDDYSGTGDFGPSYGF